MVDKVLNNGPPKPQLISSHPNPHVTPQDRNVGAYIGFGVGAAVACLIFILITLRMFLNSRRKHEHGCPCRKCRPRRNGWTKLESPIRTKPSEMATLPIDRREILPKIVEEDPAEKSDSDSTPEIYSRKVWVKLDSPPIPKEPQSAYLVTYRHEFPTQIAEAKSDPPYPCNDKNTFPLGFNISLEKNETHEHRVSEMMSSTNDYEIGFKKIVTRKVTTIPGEKSIITTTNIYS